MTAVSQGTGTRPITGAGMIRRTGADWITPPAPLTPAQRAYRDGPLLPMHDEYTGRFRLLTWAVLTVVCSLFWAAFFCWVLS